MPIAPAEESPVDTLHYSPVHGHPGSATEEATASREDGDVPEKPSSQSFHPKGSEPTPRENASLEIQETKGSEGAKPSPMPKATGLAAEPAGS